MLIDILFTSISLELIFAIGVNLILLFTPNSYYILCFCATLRLRETIKVFIEYY